MRSRERHAPRFIRLMHTRCVDKYTRAFSTFEKANSSATSGESGDKKRLFFLFSFASSTRHAAFEALLFSPRRKATRADPPPPRSPPNLGVRRFFGVLGESTGKPASAGAGFAPMKRDRTEDAAVATKKAKLEPIIAALEESVSDAPLKELALAFEWKDSRYTPIQFQYHFVKNSLGNLLSAPSSASQKKIKAACANIRRKLDILSATSQAEGDEGEAGGDFFSLSFLSTARAETSSSLRKKSLKEISEYCRTNLTGGMKGIIGGGHRWHENDRNMTNDRFFDLLEGGPEKYVDAGELFANAQRT